MPTVRGAFFSCAAKQASSQDRHPVHFPGSAITKETAFFIRYLYAIVLLVATLVKKNPRFFEEVL
jgi:hypothetical protein